MGEKTPELRTLLQLFRELAVDRDNRIACIKEAVNRIMQIKEDPHKPEAKLRDSPAVVEETFYNDLKGLLEGMQVSNDNLLKICNHINTLI